jgi:3',5'-cyclic AMP phosphodiesterase CpdA
MFIVILTCFSLCVGYNPPGDLWYPEIPFDCSKFPALVKGGDFKILQLTDLHINSPGLQVINALTMVEELVHQTNPDLIIMTGDSVCGNINDFMADVLVTLFDSFKIPYTFTLGNHDGEGIVENPSIAKIYANGKFSFYKNGSGSIHGYSNSAINLENSQGIVYSLILIDTNRYRDYPDGSSGYDYVYPDQIRWYEWYINSLSNYSKKDVKSLMFYHIPLPEINDVRTEMAKVDPNAEKDAFRENPCPGNQNTGLFDKIVRLKSTTHMFFGHDHRNLLDYVYKGVHFVYGAKTGSSYYHDNDRLGGTLITVSQAGDVNVKFILK